MNEHLQQVMDELVDAPLDRVDPSIREAIVGLNCPMFDVHCHFFTFKQLSDRVLRLRLPLHSEKIDRIIKFLHNLWPFNDEDLMSDAAHFLQVGRNKSEESIAKKLFSYCPDNTIFTPLLMDTNPGIHRSKPALDYKVQMERMENLRSKYPNKLLPFVALDPNRGRDTDSGEGDVMQVFRDAFIKYNYFGVKIYPALGYLPSHPKLMKIFEICEKKRIPVVTHCSDAIIRTNRNPITNIEGKVVNSDKIEDAPETMVLAGKEAYENFFNHPRNWLPVLESYPNLILNLAHFGRKKDWLKVKKGNPENWCNYIRQIMQEYKNVYADFSLNIADPKLVEIFYNQLKKDSFLRERTLYGSDYYMVVAQGRMQASISNFTDAMGEELMHKIAYENPKRYLFGL